MGFLSFLQRRPSASPVSPAGSDEDIALARTRARRRLTGAAVLVLLGVIGFPLVFETQPRPIAVDIPIEIPRKDGAPALALPTPRKPVAPASVPEIAPREPVITETAADAGKEVAPPKPAPVPSAPAAEPAKKLAAVSKPASAPAEAARAKALLEGKDAAPAARAETPADAGGRYVVQVGAFADAGAAREMRGKVEKLGLKSYTQVVETSSGSRIRVRAGPFASRDEADKALAKAKAAGLSAVVLTL